MKLRITQAVPASIASVFVSWSIEDVDPRRTGATTFTLERSGGPRGPWDTVASSLNDPFYVDTLSDTITLMSLQRDVWYRVRATISGGDELVSAPVNLDNIEEQTYPFVQSMGVMPAEGDQHANPTNTFEGRTALNKRLTLIGRAVRRNAAVNLRMFTGVVCVLLKERSFGPRCPVCYDDRTQTSADPRCGTCYGTSYEGGFWSPILTSVRITPTPRQTSVQLEGTSSVQMAQVELVSYPTLEQDDVLVELDSGKRWLILDKQRHPSLHRTEVTQHWSASELSKTAAAYRVPVDRSALYADAAVLRLNT